MVDTQGKARAGSSCPSCWSGPASCRSGTPATVSTPYVNTIPPEEEPFFPGDEDIERRIRAYIRWNAAVMVVKANKHADGIGGHLATFASSAALYEVGFNHFFRGKDDGLAGDHIYFQGHAAPGIYARAFLEGRLTEEQLDHFRREVGGNGLSSYPHPRLMPDFWEYPTVSMGLGPLCSIYQARFNKYLHNRQIEDTSQSAVWCFIGDGECDEPETLGSISLAAREGLDNLTWVINCNLQRLDGPVRGNGKIIQELEAVFRGRRLERHQGRLGRQVGRAAARDDVDGVLLNKMNDHRRRRVPALRRRVRRLRPRALLRPRPPAAQAGRAPVRRGDPQPAPRRARLPEALRRLQGRHRAGGRPTVILAKTIKGWTLGPDVEGRNATHQIKKMTTDQLRCSASGCTSRTRSPRRRSADDKEPPYIQLAEGSTRSASTCSTAAWPSTARSPPRGAHQAQARAAGQDAFDEVLGGSGKQAASTTTAFTRLLRNLCRDPQFGPARRADHPRRGPHVRHGLAVQGVRDLRAAGPAVRARRPRPAAVLQGEPAGQILEEGITEAGGLASFIAAGTSYATHGVPMVPFFTFYSMFGFQRVGDLIWQATDAGPRASCSAPPPGAPRCSARASSTRTATASCWRR